MNSQDCKNRCLNYAEDHEGNKLCKYHMKAISEIEVCDIFDMDDE